MRVIHEFVSTRSVYFAAVCLTRYSIKQLRLRVLRNLLHSNTSTYNNMKIVGFLQYKKSMIYGMIYSLIVILKVRSGGRAVERRTVNRGDGGSIPPTAVSKLRQFRSPHIACVFRKRH